MLRLTFLPHRNIDYRALFLRQTIVKLLYNISFFLLSKSQNCKMRVFPSNKRRLARAPVHGQRQIFVADMEHQVVGDELGERVFDPKFPEHITMIWNLLKLPDSPAMAERQAPCITVPASSGLLPV